MRPTRLICALLFIPGGLAWAQDPVPVEPEEPAEAEAQAPGPVGELFVSSPQVGLRITLDGVETGELTPAVIKGVPEGLHTVEVRQECAHYMADVQVKADQIARVEADPVEGIGMLRVTTDPPGAVVYLDGKVLGASPVENGEVSCGEDHTLRVETDGFLTLERVVRVPAFATTAEHVTLEVESFGVLVISVSPLDADVFLDGEKVARGPITLEQIPNGPHELSVVREGFVPLDKSIRVSAEDVNRQDISLVAGAPPAGWVSPGEEAPAVVEEPVADVIPYALPEDPVAESTEPVVTNTEPTTSTATTTELPASFGRLALNGGVTTLGLVTGGLAVGSYLEAKDAHNRFVLEPDDEIANTIFETEVAPKQRTAAVQGVASGVILAGSAALWLTTDYTVAVTPRSVSFGWRW